MSQLDAFPEAAVDPTVDGDRRYTTRETMDLCMRLAEVQGWDLDVAADEESHWAASWYTTESNGLLQQWRGRVWCNPPFSDIAPWVAKAWTAYRDCEVVAMLLPANRTEQPWWQEDVEPWRDKPGGQLSVRFLPGRVKFGHPGNPKGVGVGSPPFGCVLLIWRAR